MSKITHDVIPLIPLLCAGLTPALQMPLLTLPTFWLAQRVAHSHTRQTAGGQIG
jgi:hypothetical protein